MYVMSCCRKGDLVLEGSSRAGCSFRLKGMGPDAPAQSLVGAAIHPDVVAPPSRAPDSRLGMPREESFPRGASPRAAPSDHTDCARSNSIERTGQSREDDGGLMEVSPTSLSPHQHPQERIGVAVDESPGLGTDGPVDRRPRPHLQAAHGPSPHTLLPHAHTGAARH